MLSHQKRLRQEQLAASYYIQAGEHFAKFDPFQAVHVYRKAVLHLKNLGHFAICATVSVGNKDLFIKPIAMLFC